MKKMDQQNSSQTQTEEEVEPRNEPDDYSEGETIDTPLDSVIARVREYIRKPEMVSSSTLQDLLSELETAKGYYDLEETEESGYEAQSGEAKPSLAILLGSAKSGGKKQK